MFNDLKIKTPCYIINKKQLEENYSQIIEAFQKEWKGKLEIGYSVKTNSFPYLIEFAYKQNFYAEVVSIEEYDQVTRLGYSEERIIINGPVKEAILVEAINKEAIINLDNLQEVNSLILNKHLFEKEPKVGLRVNFDLESKCPEETVMGAEVSRFGICVENGDFFRAIKQLREAEIKIKGIHMHYSTKSRGLNIFRHIADEMVRLITQFDLGMHLEYVDIGGGFFGGRIQEGKPSMEQYAQCITSVLNKLESSNKLTLILEPGSAVLATAIDYLTSVVNIRDIRGNRVVTMDGSNMDINPFLFSREPQYDILAQSASLVEEQIICGNTCMENDRFLKLLNKTELNTKDRLLIHNAGAYTMCFNNNFIHFPPHVYLNNYEDLLLLRDSELDRR